MILKQSKAQRIFSIVCIMIGVFSLQAKNPDTGITETNKSRQGCFKISVCDWMILKRQKIGEFVLAHEIGADGVEVDMG